MRGAGVNDGHGSGADLIHTIGPRWRQWKGESETTAEGRAEAADLAHDVELYADKGAEEREHRRAYSALCEEGHTDEFGSLYVCELEQGSWRGQRVRGRRRWAEREQ
eukprot:scaffold118388_cov32-Tisochrysis_lutea.AAC.1